MRTRSETWANPAATWDNPAAQGDGPQTLVNQSARCLPSTIWKAIGAFLAYRSMKAAEAQLQSLDDRLLKVIGLNRSEIRSALIDVSGQRRNRARMPQSFHC
jgi:uncharacterized protein YjiS (DUF1127 family)